MEGRLLDFREAISMAFGTFRRMPGVLVGAYLVCQVVAIVLLTACVVLLRAFRASEPASILLYSILVGVQIALIFMEPPLLGGLLVIGLQAVRGKSPKFADLFSGFRDGWRWMGVYFFVVCITVLTFVAWWLCVCAVALIAVALILLANILERSCPRSLFDSMLVYGSCAVACVLCYGYAVRYVFTLGAVADGAGIREAFKTSARLTQGRRLRLFYTIVRILLFAISGLIALGVGVLFTGLLGLLAVLHIYDQLKASHSSEAMSAAL